MSVKIPIYRQGVKVSYADYLEWEDDERWELIDGVPHNMAPAPSTRHQEVLGNLFAFFFQYFRDRRCRVYMAPFEVRLSESGLDKETYNVVQPDLSVICDRSKVDERGCKGAPDLIVEVLSPGMSAKRDKVIKFELYQKYKVREYWIADPANELVEVYVLQGDHFRERKVYGRGDVFTSVLFKDLLIDLNQVFSDGFDVD
jgi:Uma2 family endonuclease